MKDSSTHNLLTVVQPVLTVAKPGEIPAISAGAEIMETPPKKSYFPGFM